MPTYREARGESERARLGIAGTLARFALIGVVIVRDGLLKRMAPWNIGH